MARGCVMFILLLIGGCDSGRSAEGLLEDYLVRLGRVLAQEVPPVERRPALRLPPMRELQVVVEPLSIDLLDYWAFRECGLAPLLGERNSVLGRVMVPSQALHMDGRLIRQLAYCEAMIDDEELLALTRELLTQKQAQWPQRYWNATIASPELRQFWSYASEPLPPNGAESFRTATAAMAFLVALPTAIYGEKWPVRDTMEMHYQQLESYELGGRLLLSLQLARDYLLVANLMLDAAIAQNSLCPYGLQPRELSYARNVMSQRFAGTVQPWLATLNRHANAVLTAYDALIAAQAPELQPRIAPFQASTKRLFEEFKEANRAHVERWKMLFTNCNSEAIPGSNHGEG